MGHRPLFIRSTLSFVLLIPITLNPLSANIAATGIPTYPVPTITIFLNIISSKKRYALPK